MGLAPSCSKGCGRRGYHRFEFRNGDVTNKMQIYDANKDPETLAVNAIKLYNFTKDKSKSLEEVFGPVSISMKNNKVRIQVYICDKCYKSIDPFSFPEEWEYCHSYSRGGCIYF